jgi:hypothetical protein
MSAKTESAYPKNCLIAPQADSIPVKSIKGSLLVFVLPE